MAKSKVVQGPWDPKEEPTQERFRMLIERLGKERGYARGWKIEAARKLGIGHDHLSRILSRTRRVSLDTMQRAAARLDISPQYFFDPEVTLPATAVPEHDGSRGHMPPSPDHLREVVDNIDRALRVNAPIHTNELAEVARWVLNLPAVAVARDMFDEHGELRIEPIEQAQLRRYALELCMFMQQLGS